MSQPRDLTDSRIVMAEQSSHDVVNQTLSGGDPSPSDVPASTNDKKPAGGDVGEINHTATTTTQSETTTNTARTDQMEGSDFLAHKNEAGPDMERPTTDLSRQGPGPVPSRALEMNGMASVSDGGEDTASQGGSESDASRTDSKLNSRASSTKRTTSFKPVTFAKFAVPKAPGTPPAAKAPEKAPLSSGTPLGLPPQNPRPRLVAKSTSLRDSLSKGGPNAAKPGGGGPDPSQVWNRNQPVQQAPPKHLTDEELKQQYGIHMTSRIQEDGGGTEAKWADIDDDEDDWAPETIEWTDGTKTNLTQPEPAPPTAQDNHTRVPAAAEPKEEPLPPQQISTAREAPRFMPKPTTSIGPNPTVLRLGANAERQAKNASILSRGPNEKSPLLSSSPAPPPTKSPWAPLPPVEKISPVMPPVQLQQTMRPHMREPPHPQDGVPGIPHPKEIAADDFNRSLRETQYGTRELYNSRSGRYEPVPDTRKGPWRAEQGMRPPSLLQRPVPGEPVGPAEPSPAFQTHRAGGQDGTHWTRRRTSSNVSGGSGSFGRRMSIGRPDGVQRSFEIRRGSHANGMMEQPVFGRDIGHPNQPMRETSPTRHGPGMPWSPRGQPAVLYDQAPVTHGHSIQPPPEPLSGEQAAPVPQGPPGPPGPQGPQGTQGLQGPQESQGTQGTQEDPVLMQQRIMKEKRMEARQRRIEQEEKEEAAKRERIRQKLEALGPPPDKVKQPRRESLEGNRVEAHVPSTTTHPSHSPPKPPVPEPTGEPKQYGMMKVHHPDTVKKLIEKERAAEKAPPMPTARRAPSPSHEPKPDANIANGFPPSGEPQAQTPEKFPEAKLEEQNTQWRGGLNVSSPYSPWTSNAKLVGPPPIMNPWKPLSNDKTLGNGIFDQGLGGFPPRDISLRGHLGLDQSSVTPASQPFSAPSRSPQESASISPLPSPEVRHASYESINPIARPGPIGPPSLQHSHWQQDNRVSGTAAWHDFHKVAAKREAEESEKLRNEIAMREGPSSLPLTLNETWRQVRSGDQAGQRQIVGVTRSAENNPPMPNPLPGLDHPVGPLPFAESPARPIGTVPVRSSRFFPQATEQHKKPLFEEGDDMRSPSPPPPEDMSNHPVYTGDTNRPLVHLPAPKPIVKLPPKAVAPPPPPPTFASMVAAPPRTVPVSTATSWQEKINCLFGKKTVSEKKNALAVTSASKEPLDVPLHIASVSVSLPQKDDLPTGDGEITARQVEEAEEMFEDREVGSLPVVRVPTMAPAAAWQAAPAPSQSRLRSKILKPMQVHSIEPFTFGVQHEKDTGGLRVLIRLPGAVMAKTMVLPKKAGSHSSLRSRGSSSYKPRKTTKPREGTGSSNPKKPAQSQHTNGNGSPRHQSRNASWGPRTFSGSR